MRIPHLARLRDYMNCFDTAHTQSDLHFTVQPELLGPNVTYFHRVAPVHELSSLTQPQNELATRTMKLQALCPNAP